MIFHIFDKNGPMELDADEPRKFQGPPDRILGPADMGGSLEKRSERSWGEANKETRIMKERKKQKERNMKGQKEGNTEIKT